jgi:hypothetical protein
MLTGMQKIIETIYGKVTGSAPEKAPFASPGSSGFPQLSTNPVIPITRSGGTSQKAPAVSPQSEGKASGGISRGPVSGYSETLHGTEAVVPLPDGRSIPVSMDSSSITAAVNQQSGILAEILRAMQNNNSLTSQIVQNSY